MILIDSIYCSTTGIELKKKHPRMTPHRSDVINMAVVLAQAQLFQRARRFGQADGVPLAGLKQDPGGWIHQV